MEAGNFELTKENPVVLTCWNLRVLQTTETLLAYWFAVDSGANRINSMTAACSTSVISTLERKFPDKILLKAGRSCVFFFLSVRRLLRTDISQSCISPLPTLHSNTASRLKLRQWSLSAMLLRLDSFKSQVIFIMY